ncbi:MAG TPA: phage holin family protein [Aeromicrobium sp.]|nr:phage holin family protein [Aeromicrobium sp.]
MKFALAWVLSSLSLAVAAALLGSHMNIGTPDQTLQDKVIPVAIVGLVFCLVNTFVAPVVKVLSLPFIVLSLGLFLLVINALLLLLTEWISSHVAFHGAIPFDVDGFWWALLGAVVVSIVNAFFGAIARRA